MKYTEVLLLLRNGRNDFTLWVTELPEQAVTEIISRGSEMRDDLEELMAHLPTISESADDQIHLLMRDRQGYVLCTKDADPAFYEDYQHIGCSVRGDRSIIISEIEEFFQIIPELEAMQHLM